MSMEVEKFKVPVALFNSKALFNPYQYIPFFKVMKWEENGYVWDSEKGNLLITDEVGVGKTFEVGIILRELLTLNEDLSVLILCPVKLCDNWEKELFNYFRIGVINYHREHVLGQMNIVPYSYFSSVKHANKMINEEEEEEKLLSEYLLEGNKTEVDEKIISRLGEYDVLILDEAHYIRNKGKLWKNIEKLIERNEKDNKKKLKIFMTGTPICNSREDYNNITELLQTHNGKFKSTNSLQGEANCYDTLLSIRLWNKAGENKNIVINSVERKIFDDIMLKVPSKEGRLNVSKYGRETGFLKRISASSIFALKQYIEKKDIFVQEDKDYLTEDSYMEDSDENEDENESKIDYQKLMVYLEEWSSGEDSKLSALNELLDTCMRKEGVNGKGFKAIIFSCFICTCEYLKEQLQGRFHVYLITGQTNAKRVTEMKQSFESDTKPSILICSDAAKEGHNLQFCHYLIHYDFPFTPTALGQRNGRIYRRGQKEKPQVYYLSMEHSYDARLFGQIIIDKCQVVKDLSKKDIVSVLNVLPGDADEYVRTCVDHYIDDYFEDEMQRRKEKDAEKKAHDIFRNFLMQKFAEVTYDVEENGEQEEKKLKWKLSGVEEMYLDEKDEGLETYKKKLKVFYAKILSDESLYGSEVSIQSIYQKKYNTQLRTFCNQIFGDYSENDVVIEEDRWIENFIECSRAYIYECIGKTKNLFCHDILADPKINISKYLTDFTPLLGCGKEEK